MKASENIGSRNHGQHSLIPASARSTSDEPSLERALCEKFGAQLDRKLLALLDEFAEFVTPFSYRKSVR